MSKTQKIAFFRVQNWTNNIKTNPKEDVEQNKNQIKYCHDHSSKKKHETNEKHKNSCLTILFDVFNKIIIINNKTMFFSVVV